MEEKMTDEQIKKEFEGMMQPKVIQQVVKEKRPPAKFPELRYLWGLFGLIVTGLVILSAIVQTFLESM